MAKKIDKDISEYVTPLSMNGLNGRVLRVPGPKNKSREILMVYGLHASLERMFGFVDDLRQYGTITLPDLPGFGGMDPMYRIGEKPTLDNLADYLASFVKMRYKRKRVTIMGMSYGFLVVTRMLQKYPELAQKVDLLVSLVGFVHYEDFRMPKAKRLFINVAAEVASHRLPAWYIKTFVFRRSLIKLTYRMVAKDHRKLQDAEKEEQKRLINFETDLWQINDARTKGQVVRDMFRVNLCNEKVKLPVYHVAIAHDHFFDNHVIEQHMKVIFSRYEAIPASIPGHAPTVIADAESVAPLVPKRLRQLLARSK